MDLAGRLTVPDDTAAILWDMDGVLLDSLSLDFAVCNRLLREVVGPEASVSRETIRTFFPFDLPEFWRRLLGALANPPERAAVDGLVRRLVEGHEAEREHAEFPLNPGVPEVLAAAKARGLKLAVVSNNPTAQVRDILARWPELVALFDEVLGNDLHPVAKKPAPDFYLLAARGLGVSPGRCVVVEDSLLGAQAGRAAGCFTVGVATGAATFADLERSPDVDVAYSALVPCALTMAPGPVTRKRIETPNDFVSHMVEHVAWRTGCSIDLTWTNSDYAALGRAVGRAIGAFPRAADSAAAIGMIDDGSAEVRIDFGLKPRLELLGAADVDPAWFLSLRCEQVASGRPLVDLLEGIAAGLPARIGVTVCNLEDPHHTWEGVFRSVGIALYRTLAPSPVPPADDEPSSTPASAPAPGGDWTVVSASTAAAEVVRQTAESRVRVRVDLSGYAPPRCSFEVAPSIRVDGLTDLLDGLARAGGMAVEVEFTATRLSSSHVVMEDVGMVFGRALKEVFTERMRRWGVNGAGSSVSTPGDLDPAAGPVHVALSVEGRKFWTFVPFLTSRPDFRRRFLIGHDVGDGLFSEDLDDFIDGLSGGLTASVVVHVRSEIGPREGWPLVFLGLGAALAQAMERNPYRKGVIAGVKATMA